MSDGTAVCGRCDGLPGTDSRPRGGHAALGEADPCCGEPEHCAPTTTAPVLQTERPVTRREVATAGVAVVSGPQRHLAQCRREGLGAPTRTVRRATAAAGQAEAGFFGTVGVQPLRQCGPHGVERHPPGHRLDRIELNTDRRNGNDQRLRLGAELRRDARCEPRMATQSGKNQLAAGWWGHSGFQSPERGGSREANEPPTVASSQPRRRSESHPRRPTGRRNGPAGAAAAFVGRESGGVRGTAATGAPTAIHRKQSNCGRWRCWASGVHGFRLEGMMDGITAH